MVWVDVLKKPTNDWDPVIGVGYKCSNKKHFLSYLCLYYNIVKNKALGI